MSSVIDLSLLPPPDVIEQLDFEQINAAHATDLITRMPEVADVMQFESEPLVKQIEAFSYRELLLRARINQAARANLLAFASGADLDHKGAFYNLLRIPDESDDRYRTRIQLRIASLAGNGTAEQYKLIAMTASSNVRDVGINQPYPGTVGIVLWQHDIGQQAETIAAVLAALNADNARPLGIPVIVAAARPLAIDVTAVLWHDANAPLDIVSRLAAAFPAQLAGYASLGRSVPLSWITAVLHQPGISRVEFPRMHQGAPALNTVLEYDQYAVPGMIAITDGGIA